MNTVLPVVVKWWRKESALVAAGAAAVLPLLAAFGVVHWSPEQIAAVETFVVAAGGIGVRQTVTAPEH